MIRQHGGFLLILIIALVLRLGVVLWKTSDLETDPDLYLAHARMLTDGKGFAGPSTGQPTAYRPPGFPWLIAQIPGSAEAPGRSVAMINLAAGILTVLLTRVMAEQAGLSARMATIAAGLVAMDPLLLRYTALPMTEVVSALVLTAAIALFQSYRNALERERSGGSSSVVILVQAVVVGLLFSVATYVRPIALVVCGLLICLMSCQLLSMLLKHRPQPDHTASSDGMPSRKRNPLFELFIVMVPGIVLLVGLSPWMIRNQRCFGKIIPATTHGGYTLALGNNPDYYRDVIQSGTSVVWDGQALETWQKRITESAKQRGINTNDEPAMDSWMYEQAFAAIWQHPTSFLRGCGLRLRRFWGITPMVEQQGGTGDIIRMVVGVWYSCLWILMISGIVCAGGQARTIRSADLWTTVFAFMMMHSVYWTDTRMRAPLMPVCCVLAGIGIVAIGTKFGNQQRSEVSSV